MMNNVSAAEFQGHGTPANEWSTAIPAAGYYPSAPEPEGRAETNREEWKQEPENKMNNPGTSSGHTRRDAAFEQLEFDGDTVLCRVCGDKASGFHYGVHACEGCKGFFRRSIQQKIQYRPCLKNQQCNIMRVNRNRCQYCRLKKCISVGMSRDAVRFGRVPKKEKAKIMEQMQKVNVQSQAGLLQAVVDNERELLHKIIESHLKTCELTRAKFRSFTETTWQNPQFVDCPAHMACPLNPSPEGNETGQKWEEFSDCFTPAIRNVVSFAKCIPGFQIFSHEDQVTLLKAGTFEVLLVQLACLFDAKTNTMMFTNGKLYKRVSMAVTNSAGFLLDSMFDFAERLNDLQLTDEEIALFSALVVIASDRPGLRNIEQVEKVQSKITQGLQNVMKNNHPGNPAIFAKLLMKIPDLRTLNTLHSEKLLGLTVPHGDGTKFSPASLKPKVPENIHNFYANGFMPQTPYGSIPRSEHQLPYHMATSGGEVPIVPHQVPLTSRQQKELVLSTPYGNFHRYPQQQVPATSKNDVLEAGLDHHQRSKKGQGLVAAMMQTMSDVDGRYDNTSSIDNHQMSAHMLAASDMDRNDGNDSGHEGGDGDHMEVDSPVGEPAHHRVAPPQTCPIMSSRHSPTDAEMKSYELSVRQGCPESANRKRSLHPHDEKSDSNKQAREAGWPRDLPYAHSSPKPGSIPAPNTHNERWESEMRPHLQAFFTQMERQQTDMNLLNVAHGKGSVDMSSMRLSVPSSVSHLSHLAWDYDMRSSRSNSMSSNSSNESADSGYKTNPPTPYRRENLSPLIMATEAAAMFSHHRNLNAIYSGCSSRLVEGPITVGGEPAVPAAPASDVPRRHSLTPPLRRTEHHDVNVPTLKNALSTPPLVGQDRWFLKPKSMGLLEKTRSSASPASKSSSMPNSVSSSPNPSPFDIYRFHKKLSLKQTTPPSSGCNTPEQPAAKSWNDNHTSQKHSANARPVSMVTDSQSTVAMATATSPQGRTSSNDLQGLQHPTSRTNPAESQQPMLSHQNPFSHLVQSDHDQNGSISMDKHFSPDQSMLRISSNNRLPKQPDHEKYLKEKMLKSKPEDGVTAPSGEAAGSDGRHQFEMSPTGVMPPHPAYFPVPYPPTLHPMYMYQLNQYAAMQQYQALQHLQSQAQANVKSVADTPREKEATSPAHSPVPSPSLEQCERQPSPTRPQQAHPDNMSRNNSPSQASSAPEQHVIKSPCRTNSPSDRCPVLNSPHQGSSPKRVTSPDPMDRVSPCPVTPTRCQPLNLVIEHSDAAVS